MIIKRVGAISPALISFIGHTMIDVDIQLPKNMQRRFNLLLEKHIKQVEKDIITHLKANINSVKRFKTQTGQLESAIKVKYTDTGISIYIDENIADYAKYVYNGHGTWKADKSSYIALASSI